MSIVFKTRVGSFGWKHTTQATVCRSTAGGHLLHLYYGSRIGEGDLAALYPPADVSFSPNYYAPSL